jgi:phenylacetate-coenzyme A ligase PaaK-like adenylate-forming protein
MFETAYAQLRFAGSLLLARPFHRPSLNRLVAALIATQQSFGAPTAQAKEMLAAPPLDEATRQQLQLRRFRLQARRGQQETAYYAEHWAGLELDANTLTAETLTQLPLTTKAALRANPTAFVRRGQQPTWRTMTTGTTGQPLSLFFTEHEMESYSALAAISHLLQGAVTPADIVQLSTSARGTLANTVFMQGCQRAGALVYQTGILEPAATLALLAERHALPGKKAQASVLLTYPSYLGKLVTAGLRLGYRPADFGLERIMLGGEIVTAGLKRRCRALFGDVILEESYGISEAYPLGGAICEKGLLHVEPLTGLAEVLDPVTHQPTPPGRVGTLVLTPFAPYRESLVLLRYDSEDLVQRPAQPHHCKLDHLPAVGRLLGKRRLAVQHPQGWTTVRSVAEALEAVDELPLPARYSFHAHGEGVAVGVLVPQVTPTLRGQIETSLHHQGVPLVALELTTDPASLRNPVPLRGDLHEGTFSTGSNES